MDGAIQSDGSLLATRIAVEDSSAINESGGPVMFVDNIVPALNAVAERGLCSRSMAKADSISTHPISTSAVPRSTSQASLRTCRICRSSPASAPPTWWQVRTSTLLRQPIHSWEASTLPRTRSPWFHKLSMGPFSLRSRAGILWNTRFRWPRMAFFRACRSTGADHGTQQSEPSRGLCRQQHANAEHHGPRAGQHASLQRTGVQRQRHVADGLRPSE